jgi:hypothetical protein
MSMLPMNDIGYWLQVGFFFSIGGAGAAVSFFVMLYWYDKLRNKLWWYNFRRRQAREQEAKKV